MALAIFIQKLKHIFFPELRNKRRRNHLRRKLKLVAFKTKTKTKKKTKKKTKTKPLEKTKTKTFEKKIRSFQNHGTKNLV